MPINKSGLDFGFGLDFVKEAEERLRRTTQNMGAVLQGRTDLELKDC